MRENQVDISIDFMRRIAQAAAAETLPRFRAQGAVANKEKGSFDPVTAEDRGCLHHGAAIDADSASAMEHCSRSARHHISRDQCESGYHAQDHFEALPHSPPRNIHSSFYSGLRWTANQG